MSVKERTSRALALLIPAGVIGISSALASVQAHAELVPADPANGATSVAERLSEIRSAVSTVNNAVNDDASGAKLTLADWLNFGGGVGWHNGGWHNWGNGWGNGGWHNWGNGWHNWGNGWHNWHNFWHNW
jgi:rSAM-associated Gly-rich repeat protein